MRLGTVKIEGTMVRSSLKVIAAQPVQLEHYVAPASSLESVLQGVTAGGTAKLAWHGFQASNTAGVDDLTKLMLHNGVSEQHASAAAQAALEFIRAEPTKLLLIAVSAGGGAWAALEASSKMFGFKISTWRKAAICLVIAALCALAYHFLHIRGYLQ